MASGGGVTFPLLVVRMTKNNPVVSSTWTDHVDYTASFVWRFLVHSFWTVKSLQVLSERRLSGNRDTALVFFDFFDQGQNRLVPVIPLLTDQVKMPDESVQRAFSKV
ncbi:hypothetical protein Asppvi_002009 [Aspergillus pseudoviridinutans]|uniref:Uncharacterized protein n=1 Tax=Aspergillus pseudoviridinutans TaxID=1517512 RepID=A0A9P3BK86_9EURO|nr:uncharacterized protein Asppvi_002009 [Aspergillus pseudoviridinutans]GIJ92731.1 hypothetical protein Asppvi_002009 [Aspergillus pseudoviridinutans]